MKLFTSNELHAVLDSVGAPGHTKEGIELNIQERILGLHQKRQEAILYSDKKAEKLRAEVTELQEIVSNVYDILERGRRLTEDPIPLSHFLSALLVIKDKISSEWKTEQLKEENARLKGIIERHDLCHNMHGKVDAQDFAAGCAAEQRKLYGCAPDADRVEQLLKQLPEGMKHCTIIAKTCKVGHSWLTATNWLEHPCPTCTRNELLSFIAAFKQRAEDLLK